MISVESAEPQNITGHLGAFSDETDAELAARFVRDVMPLLNTLLGGAVRITAQRADAEDLVQETMVLAYKNFRTFQPGTNLKGWLFRIQANAHISNYRKRIRRPTELPIAMNSDWQLPPAAGRSSPALRSAEVEALEWLPDDEIRNALGALPVECRMTVYYADVAGLTYRDISEIMCIPMGTVMSRIHRGRSRLRILLGDLAAARGYVQEQRAG
jgi:RNA polymerase sigma-70 factor (ECF subfamily)